MNSDIKQVITDKLRATSETNQSHLNSLWQTVEILELDSDWFDEDARLSGSTIYIRPVVKTYTQEYANYVVLREFGNLVISKASKDSVALWTNKLTLPYSATIDAINDRIKKCTDFDELVKSFLTPIDKLTAMTVVNALMASGIAPQDCKNMNIKEWGVTADFANLKRYYSIDPLVRVYCPRSIQDNFGAAFACAVEYNLSPVTSSCLVPVLKEIIGTVCDSVR